MECDDGGQQGCWGPHLWGLAGGCKADSRLYMVTHVQAVQELSLVLVDPLHLHVNMEDG